MQLKENELSKCSRCQLESVGLCGEDARSTSLSLVTRDVTAAAAAAVTRSPCSDVSNIYRSDLSTVGRVVPCRPAGRPTDRMTGHGGVTGVRRAGESCSSLMSS